MGMMVGLGRQCVRLRYKRHEITITTDKGTAFTRSLYHARIAAMKWLKARVCADTITPPEQQQRTVQTYVLPDDQPYPGDLLECRTPIGPEQLSEPGYSA